MQWAKWSYEVFAVSCDIRFWSWRSDFNNYPYFIIEHARCYVPSLFFCVCIFVSALYDLLCNRSGVVVVLFVSCCLNIIYRYITIFALYYIIHISLSAMTKL